MTEAARSALAIELDSHHARAFLVERVDGRARVLAQGESLATAAGRTGDAAAGARAAIAQVELSAGRALYELGGAIVPRASDGGGADAIALVVSARPRVSIVTLSDVPAANSARRAMASIDAESCEAVTLDARTDAALLAQALRRDGRAVPAILLVGPGDAPALARLREALTLLAPAAGPSGPALVWAGHAAGAEVARAVLGERIDLRVVDPIRPRPDLERLGPARDAVTEVWRERLEALVPGAETVARWTSSRVVPRRRADELALAYLARTRQVPAFLIRCTVAEATILRANPDGRIAAARARGEPPDAADSSARSASPSSLRPCLLATHDTCTRRAAYTALLCAAAAQLEPYERPSAVKSSAILIGAGGLTLLGVEDATRTLIDALEPTGAIQLYLDELEGLAALGALAEEAPALAAGALADDLLRPLGAVVAPGWQTNFVLKTSRPGERWQIASGETLRLPLPEGQRLSLRAERPAWWDIRRWIGTRATLAAEGGPIGLLLDGRARPTAGPLALGRDPIEDDAPPARLLAAQPPQRPIVEGPVLIRRTRPVPAAGRILIAAGDTVGADELVAQPHGADAPAHEVVHAAAQLGVSDPRPYLTHPTGARVRAGEVIAERRLLFGLVTRRVLAPIDGALATDIAGAGSLAVIARPAGDGIAAHLPGTVVAALPGVGVTVETTGGLIAGAVGFGPERHGSLLPYGVRLDGLADRRSSMRLRGCVAVLDVLDRAQYELLVAYGLAGAVVGSIAPDLARVAGDELAVVATEGIGQAPLPPEARVALAARQGGLACLSPGDPDDPRSAAEVVLPVAVATRPRPVPELSLAIGSRVRVVGGEPAVGRVLGLPTTPRRLAGITTRAASIELDSGQRVEAPLANLELIA